MLPVWSRTVPAKRSMLHLAVLEPFSVMKLAHFIHPLSYHGLLLAAADRRRLLIEFSSFPLTNDALFLDHTLEAFDRFFEDLILSNGNCWYGNHLPSSNFDP